MINIYNNKVEQLSKAIEQVDQILIDNDFSDEVIADINKIMTSHASKIAKNYDTSISKFIYIVLNEVSNSVLKEVITDLSRHRDNNSRYNYFCNYFSLSDWFFEALQANNVDILGEITNFLLEREFSQERDFRANEGWLSH